MIENLKSLLFIINSQQQNYIFFTSNSFLFFMLKSVQLFIFSDISIDFAIIFKS